MMKSSLASASRNSAAESSSLWAQLAARIPDLRNATHYYAHDVQRMTTNLITGGGGTGADATDAEVHYQPHAGEMGFTVHHVHCQELPSGKIYLLLIIDRGFAAFEVDDDGVFEVAVDLTIPFAPLSAAIALSDTEFLLASRQGTAAVFDAPSRACRAPFVWPFQVLQLLPMRSRILVVSDFSQLFVLSSTAPFEQQTMLCAESGVVAVSQRWLAFAGAHADDGTRVTVIQQQSTLERVTKSVMSGIGALQQGLFNGAPSPQANALPLGTVVLHDVEDNVSFGSFCAHNHSLQCMKFDSSGLLLATASSQGTYVSVFQILRDRTPEPRPSGTPTSKGNNRSTTIMLLYRLSRGITTSTITDIAFSPLGHWVALSTVVGTCHLFEIPKGQRTPCPVACSATICSDEERDDKDSGEKEYKAPTFTATSRARSAPSATAVNPILTFLPYVAHRETSYLVLVTAQGTVCLLGATSKGLTLKYALFIDAFSAPRPDEPLSNLHEDPESTWRTRIELVSHPPLQRLTSFLFPVDARPPILGAAVPLLNASSQEELDRAALRQKIASTINRIFDGTISSDSGGTDSSAEPPPQHTVDWAYFVEQPKEDSPPATKQDVDSEEIRSSR